MYIPDEDMVGAIEQTIVKSEPSKPLKSKGTHKDIQNFLSKLKEQ